MADRLFWRVLGVFLVVGLFAVAYGLCRISPLPSPSFSSVAHANDTAPDVQTPLPEDLKARTIEPVLQPVDNAPLAPTPKRWEDYVGTRRVSPATPAVQMAEPTRKSGDYALTASGLSPNPTPAVRQKTEPTPALPKPVKVIIEMDDEGKITIDSAELEQKLPLPLSEFARQPAAYAATPADKIAPSFPTAERASKPVKVTSEMNGYTKFIWDKDKITFDGEITTSNEQLKPVDDAYPKAGVHTDSRANSEKTTSPATTPPAEAKEPASKPANDAPSEFSKKPKTAKIILETKEGEKVAVCELLDENAVAEVEKFLYRNPSSRLGTPRNPSVPSTYNPPAGAAYFPPATSATPPAEAKEPASKPANDAPSEFSKKPKTAKIILETEYGQGWVYDLDKSKLVELQKILGNTIVKVLSPNDFAQAVAPPVVFPVTPVPTTPASSSNSSYGTPPTNPPYATTPPNYSPYTLTPPTHPPVASYVPLPRPVPNAVPPSDMPKLEFKRLNSPFQILRAKVPGGWLIATPADVIFYADPEYKWNGGSIE